jgi:hypothetical protein
MEQIKLYSKRKEEHFEWRRGMLAAFQFSIFCFLTAFSKYKYIGVL